MTYNSTIEFISIATGIDPIRWNEVGSGAVYFVLSVILIYAVLLFATSFMRFQNLITTDAEAEDVSPQDAFMIKIASRIAMLRSRPPQFWLLLISPKLSNDAATKSVCDLEPLLESMRAVLRKKDDLILTNEGDLLIFLDAEKDKIDIIRKRLASHISQTEIKFKNSGAPCNDLRVGCALFPESGEKVSELMGAVREALKKANASHEPMHWFFDLETSEDEAEIEQEEAKLPAYIDPVTGLLKEARARSTAQKFLSQFRQSGNPASILMIRPDSLDRHVDNFGEAVVEAIKKDISEVLQQKLRDEDLIACWENNCFIVGIKGATECAENIAKRLIGGFKGRKIIFENYKVRYTISIGIAAYPKNGKLPREVLRASSLALDDASSKGRNVFATYEPKMLKMEHEQKSKGVF